jgi:DNA-binding beta-propeller fold protein YncE
VGESTFVLDTGNDRVLKLDSSGNLLETLDAGRDAHLDFQQPMAMATDGERLYIANSLASEVLVLGASGAVEMSIGLEPQEGDRAPRPIGIAARADGGMVVSDAENHRVLFLDVDGALVRSVGSGLRAGGRDGFNVPGAITLDATGNAYVVDTLNGRIVKLSPSGAYLGEYGRLADTAGSLARPKGVAVDGAGRVFVSDGLQAAVEVFAADGTYLGVIGRRDPQDAKAGSIFEAPGALWLSGARLTVIDGVVGLVTVEIPGSAPRGAAAQ